MAISTPNLVELLDSDFADKIPPKRIFTMDEILEAIQRSCLDPTYNGDITTYSNTEWIRVGRPNQARDFYILQYNEDSRECVAHAIHMDFLEDQTRVSQLTQIHLRQVTGRIIWSQTTRHVRAVETQNAIVVIDDKTIHRNVDRPSISLFMEDPIDWNEYSPENWEEIAEVFPEVGDFCSNQLRRGNRQSKQDRTPPPARKSRRRALIRYAKGGTKIHPLDRQFIEIIAS